MTDTAAEGPIEALSFDALGTLIALEDPAPRLRESLARRFGLDVPLPQCRAAMTVEIRHYRAGTTRARDPAALAALRLECAYLLADSLALGLDGPALLPCLTETIAYRAYADTRAALDRLRLAGLRLAVVSNWDASLHGALRRLELTDAFTTVLPSAELGVGKPEAEIFHEAARRLGTVPGHIVHVGDDPVADVDGARQAGLFAVLIDRSAARSARTPRIATLAELPALLDLDRDG